MPFSFFLSISFLSQDSRGREWTIFYSTLPLPPAHEHSDIYLETAEPIKINIDIRMFVHTDTWLWVIIWTIIHKIHKKYLSSSIKINRLAFNYYMLDIYIYISLHLWYKKKTKWWRNPSILFSLIEILTESKVHLEI